MYRSTTRRPRLPGADRWRTRRDGYDGERRWPRRLFIVIAVLLALLIVLLLWVNASLNRIDALPDEGRPDQNPGTDYLIVGSDSRAGLSRKEQLEFSTGRASGRRTDTMMLMHTGSSGTSLISLPRDSYVPIAGHGRNKLNAAFAFGGPKLLASTVETVTGVQIDHYVEVDLRGFVDIVEAVGGVRVCVKEPIADKKAGIDLKRGCQELNGPDSLGYVRSRYTDPLGDLGRVQRQQQFLSALSNEVASPATLLNPFAMWGLTNAGVDSVRVDEGDNVIDLIRFAFAMRAVSGGDGVRTTVPVSDPGYSTSVGSTVKWDTQNALRMFNALQEDRPIPKDVLPPKG